MDVSKTKPDIVRLEEKFRGQTIELSAKEVSIVREVERKATAEEAIAVMCDLWRDILALEEEEKKLRRKRTKSSNVDQVLIAGQIMALKGALTRHVLRHHKGL